MLLSKRVENDETVLLDLIETVVGIAAGDNICWATDLNSGGAALLIALLDAHAQQLLYIPGRIVHHAAATYRGDGKTDAKDARIIADQARMRTDLQPVHGADQISVDLTTAHRPPHRSDLRPSPRDQPTPSHPVGVFPGARAGPRLLQEQGGVDVTFGVSDPGWVAPHRNYPAHHLAQETVLP
ncbi:transposase [Rhodococcus erythropolis]|nr:transposase [Rhodococcus erythropolis]